MGGDYTRGSRAVGCKPTYEGLKCHQRRRGVAGGRSLQAYL